MGYYRFITRCMIESTTRPRVARLFNRNNYSYHYTTTRHEENPPVGQFLLVVSTPMETYMLVSQPFANTGECMSEPPARLLSSKKISLSINSTGPSLHFSLVATSLAKCCILSSAVVACGEVQLGQLLLTKNPVQNSCCIPTPLDP